MLGPWREGREDCAEVHSIHSSNTFLPAAVVDNSLHWTASRLKYLQLSASLPEGFLPHPWEFVPMHIGEVQKQ